MSASLAQQVAAGALIEVGTVYTAAGTAISRYLHTSQRLASPRAYLDSLLERLVLRANVVRLAERRGCVAILRRENDGALTHLASVVGLAQADVEAALHDIIQGHRP